MSIAELKSKLIAQINATDDANLMNKIKEMMDFYDTVSVNEPIST